MRRIFITLSMMLFVAASNLFAQVITPGQEVDLGLSVNWGGWNIGASSPEEYGDYYGFSSPNGYYDEESGIEYKPDRNISGTKYDVVRQIWGGSWRMPTTAEIEELISKCTWTWITYKGVPGYKVAGPSGNCIFLPAAGYIGLNQLYYEVGSAGYYWSAMSCEEEVGGCAYECFFDNGDYGINYGGPAIGHSVRPVKNGEEF